MSVKSVLRVEDLEGRLAPAHVIIHVDVGTPATGPGEGGSGGGGSGSGGGYVGDPPPPPPPGLPTS